MNGAALEEVSKSPIVVFYVEGDDSAKKLMELFDETSLNIPLPSDSTLASTICKYFKLKKLPALRYFGDSVYTDEDIEERLNELDAKNTEKTREFLRDFVLDQGITLFLKGTVKKPYCRFTKRLVALLPSLGDCPIKDFDVLCDQKMRHYLKAATGHSTFPMIFIDGNLIGGLESFEKLLEERK